MDLKVFSVKRHHEKDNLNDFAKFAGEKVRKGYTVSWFSYKNNSPVAFYDYLRETFNGEVTSLCENSDVLYFVLFPRAYGDDEKRDHFAKMDFVSMPDKFKVPEKQTQSDFTAERGVSGTSTVATDGQNNAELIGSATIQDLLDHNNNEDQIKFHRREHLAATKAVGGSEIVRVYASTVELRTKSEHFKTNSTYYRQWVLFKDFRTVARNKKIKIEDAVDYALNFGDVTCRCNCSSQLYHGFSFMGDKWRYLYGLDFSPFGAHR